MEQEYGIEYATALKQRISDKVSKSLRGEFVYKCYNCENDFISTTRQGQKNKYCSKQCKYDLYNCIVCNVETLSPKNHSKKPKNIFCGRKCYDMWTKENNKPPQSEYRKSQANSPEAIERRLKTRIALGQCADPTIFVDNMDYDQYIDVVRTLTKKLRKEIYKNWNGIDYYDGEYIKENFEKYHFTHGDYPSIDHKISALKGFINKWPPSRICELDNLVITKKRNNSSKQQKTPEEFLEFLKNK